MLASNKGQSWVDFIPSDPPPMEKLIHFDCREELLRKSYFGKVQNHCISWLGMQLWALASNYWFCRLIEVKKHSLSVAFFSTSLSLLDLLVITHTPHRRSQMTSRFFARQGLKNSFLCQIARCWTAGGFCVLLRKKKQTAAEVGILLHLYGPALSLLHFCKQVRYSSPSDPCLPGNYF